MKRLFIGCLALLGIVLSGCSSITMLRTKEMKSVGNDVKMEVNKSSNEMRLEIDSLRAVIDSMYAEQDLVNKRLRAELSLLATSMSDESQRNDSRQEEVLYRLDLLLVFINGDDLFARFGQRLHQCRAEPSQADHTVKVGFQLFFHLIIPFCLPLRGRCLRDSADGGRDITIVAPWVKSLPTRFAGAPSQRGLSGYIPLS